MAFIKLQFRPGVNRDQTDYTNEGGWYACDKIRFRSGYPEKLGGWLRATTSTFVGVCRQMLNWITTFGDNFLALGTNAKVYIEVGGNYYDITPLRDSVPTLTSPNTNNSVSVASGSNVVVFSLAVNPNTAVNNYVQVSGVVATAISVTFSNGSADITGTGLPVVNTPIQFATTGTLPTNFATSTTYYVVSNSGGTTIQVSGIPGGTAIVAGSAGSGVQTLVGTIGGIPISIINGNHKVTATNANTFSVATTINASATVTGAGGTGINIGFEITPGFPIPTAGYGWGTGTWGSGQWGNTQVTQPVLIAQTDWWFDNFDNDLVMNIRNGQGYIWERELSVNPASVLNTKAIRLKDYADAQNFDPDSVPVRIGQLLVSQQDKHLIAFGAVPFGSTNGNDFDPLLIRWASQDSPGQWTPAADGSSSAGFLRISRGSRIIRALPTRQEILVWTDTHLYTLKATATLDVFYPEEYADNISIISPRAVASAANITYWMGQDKFYAYTGRIETLPCSLRNHVFNDINIGQAAQIVCGTNEQWNEVWWFYPTSGSNYNNAYVVFNHLDKIWYYGELERTAWLDTPLRPYPQAANSALITNNGVVTTGPGYLYNHEQGLNADGVAMESFIQSSDFDLDDGDKFILTRRIIPDVNFDGSIEGIANPVTDVVDPIEVDMEIRTRNFPGSQLTSGQDTEKVTQTSIGVYTGQVFLRARARQMALKIMSSGYNVQWQLGSPRLDGRPDGAR